GHLVDILEPLPPFVARGQRHFADNLACRCMCQRERTIGAPRNAEQQLMLTLRQASKGAQPRIRREPLDQRRWTKIAQQKCSLRRLQYPTTRWGCAAVQVQ